MLRRLAFGLFAAGLLLLAAPAFAQPTTTQTETVKGIVETFVAEIPPTCEGGGPLYVVTTISNVVVHETFIDGGGFHATNTQTGTFSAVPLGDPTLPSYTGKFTSRGGFNQAGPTVNNTFRFSLTAKGSDGSTVHFHDTGHYNVRPDSSVNEFFHCH
jgi:hypothetical protein